MNATERATYIKKLIRTGDTKKLGEAVSKHFLLNKEELKQTKTAPKPKLPAPHEEVATYELFTGGTVQPAVSFEN